MSEDLRRQLAGRLYSKTGTKQKSSARNFSTSNLKAGKSNFLVAKLSTARMTSVANLGSSAKLQPLSPYLRANLASPKTDVLRPAKREPEEPEELKKPKTGKVQLPPITKGTRVHVHGDGRLLRNEDIAKRTQQDNPTTFDLIQTIKNDPELTEDFWYCNRKEDAYDFETVPFKKRNQVEYLTISSRGVTHFSKGDAYFLSIEEWEREYRIYHKLKQINFFKQYKKWKNFSLWKNLRRRNMINDRAEFLNSELLVLDERLRNSIFEVREYAWSIVHFDLVDLNMDRVRSLASFKHDQDHKRQRVGRELERVENDIKDLIVKSCNDSLDAFEAMYNINSNAGDPAAFGEEDGQPFLKGDLSNKHMPYTQESMIRTHHKKLTRFIRMCDYQIIDSKQTLSVACARKVLDALSAKVQLKKFGTQSRCPLLKVELAAAGTHVVFAPTIESIRDAITDALLRALTMLLNNHMLVNSLDFEKFTKSFNEYEERPNEEEFDVLQMVMKDPEIEETKERIEFTLNKAFDEVVRYSNKYKGILMLYEENMQMSVEKFKTMDSEEIRREIEKYECDYETFKEIPEEEKIGIFQLHTEHIKTMVLPTPKMCLEKIHDFLPKVAMELATELITYFSKATENLKATPKDVGDYVRHYKCIREIEDNYKEIEDKTSDLNSLKSLMENCGIVYGDQLMQKFQRTQQLDRILDDKRKSFAERRALEHDSYIKRINETISRTLKQLVGVKTQLADERIASKDSDTSEMVRLLAEITENFEAIAEKVHIHNEYLNDLDHTVRKEDDLSVTAKDLTRKREMWYALHEWQHKIVTWRESPFVDIDVATISKEVNAYYEIAKRSKILEEQNNFVPQILKAKVEVLKGTMPVVVDLRCQALKERHWEKLRKILNTEIDVTDREFKLKDLLEMKVDSVKDQIAEVALSAQKEDEIAEQLQTLVSSWDSTELMYVADKDRDRHLLVEVDEITNKLDETLVSLNSFLANRFVEPLRAEVETQFRLFKLFSSTFEECLLCQKKLLELEKIFKNTDIAKKMKGKDKEFPKIDEQFKEKMKSIVDNSLSPVTAFTKEGLLKFFQDANKKLEKLQKNLEEYLDKQRDNFPRFYFLSNEELILLLTLAHNPKEVQPLLKNIFENIYELEIDETKQSSITTIISAERECVALSNTTKAKGNIEEWLKGLELVMFNSLRKYMQDAQKDYSEMSRKEFLESNHPTQVISVMAMIMWCHAVEEALASKDADSSSLADCSESLSTYLEDLTQMIKEQVPPYMRQRLTSMIIQVVHNRDVVDLLREEELVTINDFKWQKQLRYYWNFKANDCYIRQIDAEFSYGYEFLGATPRLVITPLTDRCWMTITSALRLNMGANPTGPAGTGKTESTKDLAKAMGRYCIVFNCSEQVTHKMMEKLFIGLCYTGSWSCLDEFNRIDIEVLSVIAQQLRTIKTAKDECKEYKENKETKDYKVDFMFEDKVVKLQSSMGVFITMNPGYVGRSELPDNLKVLFRPISMMVPKYDLIAKIMLSAEGFQDAKRLSRKLTQLYRLCAEQLSQQQHYDFGLRAIKTVLSMAGNLIRRETLLPEDIILIRALREANLPKFLKNDAVLFNAIVQDLFPETSLPPAEDNEFTQALRTVLEEDRLQAEPNFLHKVHQLFLTLEVRFGVMIIGPAASGKSTTYKSLAKAMTHLRQNNSRHPSYQPVVYQILNPKSVDIGELFGQFNSTTQEWKDGLASSVMREFARREELTRRWVVFDGPVDSLWVENMNTVLDDNMMLCLANQERIKLKREMRVLFEVMDLSAASPATVSRCGMVYFDTDIISWQGVARSWLDNNLASWPDEAIEHLWYLMTTYLPKAFTVMRKALVELIPTINTSATLAFCRLVKAVVGRGIRLRDEPEHVKKFIDKVFVFCVTWSVGGALDSYSMTRFDNLLRADLSIELPGGSFYDSYIDMRKPCGAYTKWDTLRKDFNYDPTVDYHSLIVATKDTVRFGKLLKYNMKVKAPVFYTGRTGVGKTLIVQSTLQQERESKGICTITLTFSSHTTSLQTQKFIVGKLESKGKDIIGGPGSKRVALLVDDVNMPAMQQFGSQPPVELLRQFCDHGYIYDRAKKSRLEIVDVSLICCAAPPEGGRNNLTPRFTRHFHLMAIPDNNPEITELIFKSILNGFFDQGFVNEVGKLSEPMVVASVSLYDSVCKQLLPTPTKSHYLFNLRDISKVFQGVLMASPSEFGTSEDMFKLWLHENLRVYSDRLTDQAERQWLGEALIKVIAQHFNRSYEYADLFSTPTIFCDFLKPHLDLDERAYQQVPNLDVLKRSVSEAIDYYNKESRQSLDLVVFKDAMEHLARACRVLRQTRGHLLAIGVSGCGKQCLTKLAAFLCKCELFQLQVMKDYRHANFREDMKNLYEMTGGPNAKPHVFLIPENRLANEQILEDINSILNTGEIPNHYTADEIDSIEQALRPVAEAQRVVENLHGFFIERVRSHLHIVMSMSPAGSALRHRIRMFPSLINACTIDWYDQWPADALLSVATTRVADLHFTGKSSDELSLLRQQISELCVGVHMSVQELAEELLETQNRKLYITPKSFLDMIRCFSELLDKRQDSMNANRGMYETGVKQLLKTREEVNELEATLTSLRPQLEQKQRESAELTKTVEAETAEANKNKERVEAEEREVNLQAETIREAQFEAERDFMEVLPKLEEAMRGVEQIKQSEIAEIRSFSSLTPLVEYTLECIAILFKVPTTLDSIRSMLHHKFLDKVQNFPKDSIQPPVLHKLRNKINSNRDFTPELVGRQNVASKSLCQWVLAIENYASIVEIVEPKKLKLQEENKNLAEATEKLRLARAKLEAEMQNVEEMQQKLQQVLDDKEALDNQVNTTNLRLERASVLTDGLKEEAVRWREKAQELLEQVAYLIGDTFVSASCISYYGPFPSAFRSKMTELWLNLCSDHSLLVSPQYTFQEVMGDPLVIREWNMATLPPDPTSIDNAILVKNSLKWPLMIDPQEQANHWIREFDKPKVIKHSAPDLGKVVEACIRDGIVLLVEDAGEVLSPALEPILNANIIETLPGKFILRSGESELDYLQTFKLYLTTKLANPEYLPDVSIRVSLIDFTVTVEGLEEQLLADVVRKEDNKIEGMKDELVRKIAENEKLLYTIEQNLLEKLSNSTENILDNQELITNLSNSKNYSVQTKKKVADAQENKQKNEIVREQYRAVARRASLLYFAVADMAFVDPMYQFSLNYFSKLFNATIDRTPSANSVPEKVQKHIDLITHTVYLNVSRGIFSMHKLLFSLFMTVSLLRDSGQLREDEWELFLRGATVIPADFSTTHNPSPQHFSETMWNYVIALQNISPPFKRHQLGVQISVNLQAWLDWINSAAPECEPVPAPYKGLSAFHRLLLVRAFRTDKVMHAAVELVSGTLGSEFLQTPGLNLEQIYTEESKRLPIVFILSPGADPMSMIIRLAQSRKPMEKLDVISLGKGQEDKAKKAIDRGVRDGKWVILQNCHLARSWMPELEKICETFEESKMNEEFRLFLTSKPFKEFPVVLLQNSVKLSIESSKGLKTSMARTLTSLSEERLQESAQPEVLKKLVFSLCFFHAVIQERIRFGPIGWNIRYEFSENDFDTSLKVIENALENEELPWDALRYVIGKINYGGRVTDKFDRRCLSTILSTFISPEVLVDEYKFSENGVYHIPNAFTLDAYNDYIASLPLETQPELFGVHENANISYEQHESSALVQFALTVPSRSHGAKAAGLNHEDIVNQCAERFLSTLPNRMMHSEACETLVTEQFGVPDALSTFLFQEVDRFNLLLMTVKTSLEQLLKALKGQLLMSNELEAMFHSLLNNQVPANWNKVGYSSRKPLAGWYNNMKERVDFVRKWLREDRPASFWLNAFFFPQGFLTSVLQNHARRLHLAVDHLTFAFDFQTYSNPDQIEDVDDGVYIHGLYLEGCRWDFTTLQLEESLPREVYSVAPVILFVPTDSHPSESEEYMMPVYKNTQRAGALSTTGHSMNYIISIECPTSKKPSHWILRGAAFICELDD